MDLPPVPCSQIQSVRVQLGTAAARVRQALDEVLTYITTGEVTALEHEVGDHTVERGALVANGAAIAVLESCAELLEVVGGLGDNVVVQLEDNTAGVRGCSCRGRASVHVQGGLREVDRCR